MIEEINTFKKKVETIVDTSGNKNECLFVGIDHWGSILAARLGAATNIISCSVAIRGQAGSYDECEIINDKLTNIVREKKYVFVISDVISTGNSVATLLKTLKGSFDGWYGFTVVCDPNQDRGSLLEGYEEIFYVCGKLKMPIIQTSLLPDKQILNTDKSFI